MLQWLTGILVSVPGDLCLVMFECVWTPLQLHRQDTMCERKLKIMIKKPITKCTVRNVYYNFKIVFKFILSILEGSRYHISQCTRRIFTIQMAQKTCSASYTLVHPVYQEIWNSKRNKFLPLRRHAAFPLQK